MHGCSSTRLPVSPPTCLPALLPSRSTNRLPASLSIRRPGTCILAHRLVSSIDEVHVSLEHVQVTLPNNILIGQRFPWCLILNDDGQIQMRYL